MSDRGHSRRFLYLPSIPDGSSDAFVRRAGHRFWIFLFKQAGSMVLPWLGGNTHRILLWVVAHCNRVFSLHGVLQLTDLSPLHSGWPLHLQCDLDQ